MEIKNNKNNKTWQNYIKLKLKFKQKTENRSKSYSKILLHNIIVFKY